MADEQVTITVDGQSVQVPKGALLVEAAKAVSTEIPVFCYHPKLDPVGMCRMCLVETGMPGKNKDGTPELDAHGNPVIRFMPKLVTACTTPVADGMHVRTATPRIEDAWRGTLEFLLTSHPLDCPVCDKGGECPLQDLTFAYGPDLSRFYKRNKYHFEKPIPLGDLIWLDRERCIYCARCVRFQDEIAGDPVLKFADRNRGQEIVTFSDPPFDSYFSGNTSDICPVGALTTEDFRFKARVWELSNVPSVDVYDSVGSNLVLGTRSGSVKRVMPRENEWVNEIWLSDKSRFGHHFIGSVERLTTPLIKENGSFRPATWDEALTKIANRLAQTMATNGEESIGGIAGDRLGNEDLYLFGRLMREVVGTNNLDFRLHFPANTGIENAIRNVGLASTSNLSSLRDKAAVLVVGGDLEEEQPALYLRLRRATRAGTKLMVAQSRTTKEIKDAHSVLRVRPGTEAHLATALLKAVIAGGQADFGKLGGVEALTQGLDDLSLDDLCNACGVDKNVIEATAGTLTGAESLMVLVGREGLENAGGNARALVDALAALVVASGKAGKANSGLAALWAHNNSQGAADMGILPDYAAGYEAVATPGASIDEMLDGRANLKAAYIVGSNPVVERPSSRTVLENLDFLVVQELFMTETAQLADVVLPAASFAERDGSFTNFERRVQRYLKALDPVGDALPDWEIFNRLAHKFEGEWGTYYTAHDVNAEIAKKVKLHKGFTYDKLRGAPVGWATTAGGHHIFTGTSVKNTWYGLVWESEAESRRPKFDLRWSGLNEAETANGFRLIRRRVQYDNGTLIRHSHLLDGRRAGATVSLNPADAERLGVQSGDAVELEGNGTRAMGAVEIDNRLYEGTVAAPVQIAGFDVAALGTAVTVRKAVPEFA
jgi:NADH-quinone oxidoreductase subunit G